MPDGDETQRGAEGVSAVTSKMLDKLLARLKRHNQNAEELATLLPRKREKS